MAQEASSTSRLSRVGLNQRAKSRVTMIPLIDITNPHLSIGDIKGFYNSRVWRRKRREVLTLDHNECQHCKEHGKYTKATEVHHVNKIKDRPDLALEIYTLDKNKKKYRNLISLCKQCHKQLHDDEYYKEPLTEERCD